MGINVAIGGLPIATERGDSGPSQKTQTERTDSAIDKVSVPDEAASGPEEKDLFGGEIFAVLTGLTALYIAAAFSHSLLAPDLEFKAISLWVAATSGVLLGLRWVLGRWSPLRKWVDWYGAVAVGLIILTSLFHLYVLSETRDTLINLALLGLGMASFLLPFRTIGLVLATTLGFWVFVAWFSLATPAWLHFAFGLFAAAGLRIQNEIRKTKLEHTRDRLQVALRSAAEQLQKRRKVERALRESKERYSLIAQGTNDGLWDWDLRADEFFYSPRWKSMIGFSDGDISDTPAEWFKRVHPDDRQRLELEIAAYLKAGESTFETEYRILHKDGNFRWMVCRGLAVRDEENRAFRMAGSQTDITARKTTEQQLFYDASHDPLTSLPNRALFLERLETSIRAARRRPDFLFAVIFMDLDRFKVINDSLGHLVGDRLLKSVADRLQQCLRAVDTVARLGGDEFAILLHGVKDLNAASRTADRIRHKVNQSFMLAGREVFTTASMGIVVNTPEYSQADELLRDADTAMYRAKMRGKDCREVFDERMHDHAVQVMQLEHDLRRAVDRNEFRLHYQPIVSLTSGQITGVEALLRWKHSEKGLLVPSAFLQAAEETGLIIPIGWWSLSEACRQMREWHEMYPQDPALSISVNLSSRQFEHPDLVRKISESLEESGLAASNLIVEITESVSLQIDDVALEKISCLREMGIRLHLDDFGTGYSSLSHLNRLPFDASKIDQSFMRKALEGDDQRHIVESMVDLMHNLGMDVIVEGVETDAQLSAVRALKCDYGQGYYFSRPVENSRFAKLLKRVSRAA